jgi:hypothetical protein
MARVKYGTNIDKDLIRMAKEKAQQDGLDGANVVIEAALRLYFANCATDVWEKSIRSRKVRSRYNPKTFTDETLTPKGWTKVWKMKQG